MDLRDQLKQIQKSVKAQRYITCSICNEAVLRKNMVKHFLKHGI